MEDGGGCESCRAPQHRGLLAGHSHGTGQGPHWPDTQVSGHRACGGRGNTQLAVSPNQSPRSPQCGHGLCPRPQLTQQPQGPSSAHTGLPAWPSLCGTPSWPLPLVSRARLPVLCPQGRSSSLLPPAPGVPLPGSDTARHPLPPALARTWALAAPSRRPGLAHTGSPHTSLSLTWTGRAVRGTRGPGSRPQVDAEGAGRAGRLRLPSPPPPRVAEWGGRALVLTDHCPRRRPLDLQSSKSPRPVASTPAAPSARAGCSHRGGVGPCRAVARAGWDPPPRGCHSATGLSPP